MIASPPPYAASMEPDLLSCFFRASRNRGIALPLSMSIVVSIDFETADTGADSACAVGMARVENGAVTGTLYHLLRPPRPRVWFTKIHGLTWPMVKNQPVFREYWPEMAAFMEGADYLVAHNAPFDRRVLHGCCAAAGIPPPGIPFACTLKGARRALPIPSRTLRAVCDHLGIALRHHHAGSDALAAAHIYLYLLENGVSAEELRLR